MPDGAEVLNRSTMICGSNLSKRELGRSVETWSNSHFHEFNMNKIGSDWQDAFDIVLCLETLEHTGNFRNAFYNLWISCKPGGYLVTTVPIEVGIPGIVKFFGRKLIYRRPYRRFFAVRSERAYVRALLTGADLEAFRVPGERGWPEHLGFDNRRFEEFLWSEFIEQRRLVLVRRRRTGWGFGRLYIMRKAFPPDEGPRSSPHRPATQSSSVERTFSQQKSRSM